MNNYLPFEEVFEGLGDKAINILSQAVVHTRRDLELYHQALPGFAAQHSQRGQANWISDRLWQNVMTLSDGIPDIFIIDKGATREMIVGNYRIRIKRHDEKGRVEAIPTKTAQEFFSQPPVDLQLAGLEQVNLTAGYIWLKDSHEIGPAVLSLRDGKNNLIWCEELPDTAQLPVVEPLPAREEPEKPVLEPRRPALRRDVMESGYAASAN